MMADFAECTPAEFKTVRESLGVPASWLADQMGMQERAVRRWEDGERRIPADAWVILVHLEQRIESMIDGLLDELGVDDPDELADPVIFRVPRVDADSPDDLPASVHRALAARLRWELPDKLILEYGPDREGQWAELA